MSEPIKGVAYEYFQPLVDQATGNFLIDPTIAAGDFQVSKDGGAFVNLVTLPVVSPSGSSSVKFNLSSDEMNADKVVVQGIDAAGDQWDDVSVFIDIPGSNSETAADLLEGDHKESNTKVQIFKKGTNQVLLDKNISGSLLTPGVTISTNEP